MRVHGSRNYWNKQLILLLVFMLVAEGFFTMLAPQTAKAAAPAPGGVSGDLISWVEFTKSMEQGKIENNLVTELQDLADEGRKWTPFATKEQKVENIGNKMINFHLVTVPESSDAAVQYKTNSPFADPTSNAREVFSVQSKDPDEACPKVPPAGTYNSGFPWAMGGTGPDVYCSPKRGFDGILFSGFGSTQVRDKSPNPYQGLPTMLNVSSAVNYWRLNMNGAVTGGDSTNTVNWETTGADDGYYAIGGAKATPFKGGNIAEVLVYNRTLTDTERQQVNSYLALKYGITMGTHDYLASDGKTKMLSHADNTGYGRRITGIGRDDNGTLNQKQSKSQVAGANVTIALGDAIEATNEANTNLIANDKSFFIFSDNNLSTVYAKVIDNDDLPASHQLQLATSVTSAKMMNRAYKVDKSADWSDAPITLKVDGADARENQVFLFASPDSTFSSDVTALPPDASTGQITLNSSVLSDGSYFTFVEYVDKRSLESLVIDAGTLAEADYTAASWQAFQQALADSNSILTDANKMQDEVNAALKALEDARAALVSIAALQEKVDEINGEITGGTLKETDYTPASWTELQNKLGEAQTVLDNPNATKAEIDAALKALETARGNLVMAGAELESLNVFNADDRSPLDFEPPFDGDRYLNYTTVSNSVYGVGIELKALNPNSTVKVTFNGQEVDATEWDRLPLQEGLNVIKVEVTDPNGNTNVYRIEVYRVSNKLISLTPSTGVLEPAFDTLTENYKMSVTNSVYQLHWTPVTLDSTATIEFSVNGGAYAGVASGTATPLHSLQVGDNTVVFKVTDQDGVERLYTVIVTRASAPTPGDGGGDGNGGNGGNGGNEGGSATAPVPSDGSDIRTSVNGKEYSFATGKTSTSGDRTITSVQVDLDKLNNALNQGNGQKLEILSPKDSDLKVDGLTAETVKQIADKGATLEISNPLAIYPVPGGKMDFNGVSKQLDNAALGDIAVHIDIKRSSDTLINNAKNKASAEGYELLVNPVDLDLTFSHGSKTVRSEQLNGYAAKYIALPEDIDPNRITTGVIVNPDGSVFHVPTVVTKINNRYYAMINDLRSSGSYSVIWNPQDFDDVKNHWGKADVNNIAARLDLAGTGNNTFSPDRNVTRSEFSEIVGLGLGLMRQNAPENMFPDVPASAWYRNSVAIATEFDIVRGYDDGNFYGDQQITREQGIAMVARAYNLIDPQTSLSENRIAELLANYKDAASVSAWARAEVARLIEAGIVQGNGPQLLSPQSNMTRAETTALIARLLKTTNLIDK